MLVGTALLAALLEVVYHILDFVVWLFIIQAVLSWLMVFGVVNRHNRFVFTVYDFTTRVTEPILRPLRRYIPLIGGMDLSPLVVIFGVSFLQSFIRHLVAGL